MADMAIVRIDCRACRLSSHIIWGGNPAAVEEASRLP